MPGRRVVRELRPAGDFAGWGEDTGASSVDGFGLDDSADMSDCTDVSKLHIEACIPVSPPNAGVSVVGALDGTSVGTTYQYHG